MIKTFLIVDAFSINGGWGRLQKLKKVWRIGSIKIWTKVIDMEEVPQHVCLEVFCYGYTEWKSKWRGNEGVLWRNHEGKYI